MAYMFIEDLSIADVAFEATGKDLDELFGSAADALENTMVKDLKSIKPQISHKFKVAAKDLELLIFRFLEKLVFYKDVEQLVFRKVAVKAKKIPSGYEADCIAEGEKLDPKKHELLVDVKAVTMHMLDVHREDGAWKARIVLDI